jgi:hypothetical protein
VGYDGIGLRPATVEELAAQERAQDGKNAPPPRHRRSSRRPFVIILVTLGLLAVGAGAFALANNADNTTGLTRPYGPDAPFGVGYVDGFGEHSPKPTQHPSARKPRPSQTALLSPLAVSAGPAPSPSESPDLRVESDLAAVHWSTVSNGRFDTFIWVHNDGLAAADWAVRVRLSSGAELAGSFAVNRRFDNGTWVFTSTKGSLGAGLVYLFSFSGTTGSGGFSLTSCTVNDSPCQPFR